MEALGFLRVARAMDAVSARALRTEVLAELRKQPWWWSTPLRGLFGSDTNSAVGATAAPGDASVGSDSTSLFQETNIRSSFRRRLLVLPVDDPNDPKHNTAIGALCREAIRAVVHAHTTKCVRPDGTSLLSPDARLVELTAVVALPGAFAQDPHADILDEDEDEDEDEDDCSVWGEHAESYPEDSYLGWTPVEVGHLKKKTTTVHSTVPFGPSGVSSAPKNPTPTLLTTWVSLQPVGVHGGATVIFPGTHLRGEGLVRTAPSAVRAYRGSDLSEEDERFIQLMAGDSVDAANEGYAMAALELSDAEVGEIDVRRRSELRKRERRWRRLRFDAAAGAGASLERLDKTLLHARRRELHGTETDGTGTENTSRHDDSEDEGSAAAGEDRTSMKPGRSRDEGLTGNAPTTREPDAPPSAMTNADAGDLVVMDTKVWHFGSANRSFEARILINVTFQEPTARPKFQRRKREDVLCCAGWETDAAFEAKAFEAKDLGDNKDETNRRGDDEATNTNATRSVRRIDGFTYHIHKRVLGKYAVRDFMEGGVMC